MDRLTLTLAAAALVFSADVSGVLRPPAVPLAGISSAESALSGQGSSQAPDNDEPATSHSHSKRDHTKKPESTGQLKDASRLTIVRNVDGEMVRVVQPIPSGSKGIHLRVGSALDQKLLRIAVASTNASINPGDRAQITKIGFKERQIIVDINGGGKGKSHWQDHVQMEVGGDIPMVTTSTTAPGGSADVVPGATIFLDFDKPLPDLTPEELEKDLAPLLDFSKRHSATVQWVDTLPPEIQKAIEEKQPAVGMDREMVLAALGKPDRKVREKSADGVETEDWIYGTPPEKTIFVSFEGDKVTKVDQYPK